jgi:cbb3-type cytochrome oxidase subunit 3
LPMNLSTMLGLVFLLMAIAVVFWVYRSRN